MLDLERHIQTNLLAGDARRLKDALSSIVYWGFYRMGTRDYKVERFRAKATVEHPGARGCDPPQSAGAGHLGTAEAAPAGIRQVRVPVEAAHFSRS